MVTEKHAGFESPEKSNPAAFKMRRKKLRIIGHERCLSHV